VEIILKKHEKHVMMVIMIMKTDVVLHARSNSVEMEGRNYDSEKRAMMGLMEIILMDVMIAVR
jgi:hypothetical protein